MNAFQKSIGGAACSPAVSIPQKTAPAQPESAAGESKCPPGWAGRASLQRNGQKRSLGCFDAHKARLHPAVSLHSLAPHGGRAHPEAALTVQSTVHHHFLFGLAVPGHAKHLVFVALEMPVAARQNVVFEWFHFYPRFRSFAHDVITKRIIAYFRAAKKAFAGKMRKKARGGCLHCRAANVILKR